MLVGVYHSYPWQMDMNKSERLYVHTTDYVTINNSSIEFDAYVIDRRHTESADGIKLQHFDVSFYDVMFIVSDIDSIPELHLEIKDIRDDFEILKMLNAKSKNLYKELVAKPLE